MILYIQKKQVIFYHRILSSFIAFIFIFSIILPPGMVFAQSKGVLHAPTILNLPNPGAMLSLTSDFNPPLVKGITVHPDNPLKFDFLISTGDNNLEGEVFRKESKRLIKYFLAGLTVPDNELWVNLSPYEKDRIIPQQFGQTEMGRDMLAQDYMLKQLTSSLMYPENELGQKFWERVYTRAMEEYGTTQIPMNTFNKIWIVPEKAVVYEHEQTAFIVESHLKVMLEEDYLAMDFHQKSTARSRAPARGVAMDFHQKFTVMETNSVGTNQRIHPEMNAIGESRQGENIVSPLRKDKQFDFQTEIIRDILIPEIEKEVNEGEIFIQLRQIYHSIILATWYKDNLQDSLLGQIYVDKGKTKGIDIKDKQVNQKIYDQYVEAFKKGVYNYIKEDYDSATQQIMPRKYFSGGTIFELTREIIEKVPGFDAQADSSPINEVEVDLHNFTASSPLTKEEKKILKLLDSDPISAMSAKFISREINLLLRITKSTINILHRKKKILWSDEYDGYYKATPKLEKIEMDSWRSLTQEETDAINEGSIGFENLSMLLNIVKKKREEVEKLGLDEDFNRFKLINITASIEKDYQTIYKAFEKQRLTLKTEHIQLRISSSSPIDSTIQRRAGIRQNLANTGSWLSLLKAAIYELRFLDDIDGLKEDVLFSMKMILEKKNDLLEQLENEERYSVNFISKLREDIKDQVNSIQVSINNIFNSDLNMTEQNNFLVLKNRLKEDMNKLDAYIAEVIEGFDSSQVVRVMGLMNTVASPVTVARQGGINLSRDLFDIKVKRDGNGVALPFYMQPIEIMDVEGFIPVIISVTTVTNLPLLLGLDTQNEDNPSNSADSDSSTSMLLSRNRLDKFFVSSERILFV